MSTNITTDFQICISVPLKQSQNKYFYQKVSELKFNDRKISKLLTWKILYHQNTRVKFTRKILHR